MDLTRTRIREYRRCLEYVEIFPTDQVSETGKFGNRTQKGSNLARRLGHDVSRASDSGIGYSQDYRSQWADEDGVVQDSCHLTGSQRMGRKRRAGELFGPSSYDIPRKRALVGSDGPGSRTPVMDVGETQDYGPPDISDPTMNQSWLFIENGSLKAAGQKLEDTVARLQRDVAVYRKELRLAGGQVPANLLPHQFPENLAGDSIGRCLRPLHARMAGRRRRRLFSYLHISMGRR